MNSFYVEGGQQRRPISDEQLQDLIRVGKLPLNPLVWRQAMANLGFAAARFLNEE